MAHRAVARWAAMMLAANTTDSVSPAGAVGSGRAVPEPPAPAAKGRTELHDVVEVYDLAKERRYVR